MPAISNISDILSTTYNETGKSFDVSVQDQATPILDVYLSEKLKTDITLTTDYDIDDTEIVVSSGHGFTDDSWIEIYEDSRWMQCQVIDATDDTLTLAMPLDYAYTTNAVVYRVNVNMAVDGSSTNKDFTFKPLGSYKFDVTRAIVSIYDEAAMDNGKFGGISALAKGIFFKKGGNVRHGNLFNMRTNGDVAERAFDHNYDDKAPSGQYAFYARRTFAGQDKNGVVVRLDPANEDYILGKVRDNISAVTQVKISIQGHMVED